MSTGSDSEELLESSKVSRNSGGPVEEQTSGDQ